MIDESCQRLSAPREDARDIIVVESTSIASSRRCVVISAEDSCSAVRRLRLVPSPETNPYPACAHRHRSIGGPRTSRLERRHDRPAVNVCPEVRQ
jgi:hypothetical protein